MLDHEPWCLSVQPIHEDGPCNCMSAEEYANGARDPKRPGWLDETLPALALACTSCGQPLGSPAPDNRGLKTLRYCHSCGAVFRVYGTKNLRLERLKSGS